jgi:NAD(P)-dependent dehydrogenase (short-subunit alcohol dehydrogenase family)
MGLENKVVLITGGSAGLGSALARCFAKAGSSVSICGRRADPLAAMTQTLREAGGACMGVVADVTNPDDVNHWISRTRSELGPIDVFINNASILGERLSIEQADLDVWKKVIEINLTGAFVCARAIIPCLRETQGSLINVSSGVGDHGRSLWGAYCVSKNGLEAMSEIMAGELSTDRIRVNTVDPGSMRTSMRAAAYPDEDPKTLPEPHEVADVFVYLASDRSKKVTGQRFRAKDFKAPVL